jgi:hypothetical protein
MEIGRVATFNMQEVKNVQVVETHGGGSITTRKPLFSNQSFFQMHIICNCIVIGILRNLNLNYCNH